MKRYNSTPNRLSYTSSTYSPPAKRYTVNYVIPCIILAIALAIIVLIFKSCNNKTHQTTATQHIAKTSDSIHNNESTKKKKDLRKKQEIPADTIPKDSLPPETDLKMLTD